MRQTDWFFEKQKMDVWSFLIQIEMPFSEKYSYSYNSHDVTEWRRICERKFPRTDYRVFDHYRKTCFHLTGGILLKAWNGSDTRRKSYDRYLRPLREEIRKYNKLYESYHGHRKFYREKPERYDHPLGNKIWTTKEVMKFLRKGYL